MTADPTEPLAAPPAADRLLSWREVRVLTGISRTTAWRLQNQGAFPRPVAISPGRVGWRARDVAAWTAALAPRSAAPDRPYRQGETTTTRPAPVQVAAPRCESRRAGAVRPRRKAPLTTSQMSFDF